MKRLKYIYQTLPLLFIMLCLNSCEYEIQDIDKVQEFLEIKPSSTEIILDENNLTGDILTFSWTEARQMSDEYIVSYTTKLDIVGNNFGSSTAIITYEDEGVFSKSYTSEQLQNWANEKWKLPTNRAFTLEFRVVAEWEGGPTFEAPEVRTATVQVQPIRTIVFDADKIFLNGSAVPGMGSVELAQAVENENLYVGLLNLQAGDLQLPVEFDGETNYICPKDLDGTLQDGEAENVVVMANPVSWKISTAGEYRVIVNMEKATVTIFSPAKALEPAVVTWVLDGVEQTTVVDKLWRYGSDGWAWKEINFVQSLADPQVFVYSGTAINGRTKFGVAPQNVSYVFTGNSSGEDTAVTLGNTYELFGGNGGVSGTQNNHRNSYFSIPSGTNFIVLDIRNMTAFFDKR